VVKSVVMKEPATNVDSPEYLRSVVVRTGSSLTSSPAVESSHHFRGSSIRACALYSTLGSRSGAITNNRSLEFSCRSSDRKSLD